MKIAKLLSFGLALILLVTTCGCGGVATESKSNKTSGNKNSEVTSTTGGSPNVDGLRKIKDITAELGTSDQKYKGDVVYEDGKITSAKDSAYCSKIIYNKDENFAVLGGAYTPSGELSYDNFFMKVCYNENNSIKSIEMDGYGLYTFEYVDKENITLHFAYGSFTYKNYLKISSDKITVLTEDKSETVCEYTLGKYGITSFEGVYADETQKFDIDYKNGNASKVVTEETVINIEYTNEKIDHPYQLLPLTTIISGGSMDTMMILLALQLQNG